MPDSREGQCTAPSTGGTGESSLVALYEKRIKLMSGGNIQCGKLSEQIQPPVIRKPQNVWMTDAGSCLVLRASLSPPDRQHSSPSSQELRSNYGMSHTRREDYGAGCPGELSPSYPAPPCLYPTLGRTLPLIAAANARTVLHARKTRRI